MKKNELVRLNVLIQDHGLASRRKADELIESGLVKVNGKVIKTLGTKVDKNDEIIVNGKKLTRKPTKVTYIFHKPYLSLTTRSDDRNRPTIYDLPPLKKLAGNIQPVGRLDFKSEGLLILTNDGDLALALSHPKYSVPKTYSVLLSTQISAEEIDKLRAGVELDDGFAKPLALKTSNREKLANSTGQWLEITITEGRNRLVRRMMESLGLKVVRLMRISIGSLYLPSNLPAGKLRLITDQEKKYLSDLKKTLMSGITPKKKPIKKVLDEGTEKDSAAKSKKDAKAENYKQELIKRSQKIQTLSRERKKNIETKKEAAEQARDKKGSRKEKHNYEESPKPRPRFKK